MEWRCAESADGLKILVNDVVIPVFLGKNLTFLILQSCHPLMKLINSKTLFLSFNLASPAVWTGVVHVGEQGFAVRCITKSRCAVVYSEGLNVAVWRDEAGRLAALVEVPQRFYNRTLGLLAHWSSNRTDDFLLSNGRLLPSVNNITPSEQSLIPFGQSCGSISII